MRIRVRLVSWVARRPAALGGRDEGSIEIAEGATAADLFATLDLGTDEPYVTLVNDDTVRASARANLRLADNDLFTVLPPIEGG